MVDKMDIELGWPVASGLSGDGRVAAGIRPAGRYTALTYTGLKRGMEASKALLDWAAEQGIAWDRSDAETGDAFGARLESYLTDPAVEPNLAKWDARLAIWPRGGHAGERQATLARIPGS